MSLSSLSGCHDIKIFTLSFITGFGIIIVIIIIIIISFMQGIYTYIPETNCIRSKYSFAVILLLLFTVSFTVESVVLYISKF